MMRFVFVTQSYDRKMIRVLHNIIIPYCTSIEPEQAIVGAIALTKLSSSIFALARGKGKEKRV